MPRKSKATAIDRIMRQESRNAKAKEKQWLPEMTYTRVELCRLIQRVAVECADLIDHEPLNTTYSKSRREAATTIREQFGLEAGTNAGGKD